MHKERLAAFSDGVLAIIIAVRGVELKVPHGAEWANFARLWLGFLSYAKSFLWAIVSHWLSISVSFLVAMIWLIPDPRIEKAIGSEPEHPRP